MKKKERWIRSGINKIQIICMFAFAVCTLYICYDLYYNYKEKHNDKMAASMFKQEKVITENMKYLEELQKENPDIIGWIAIPETNINYPVLQATDNSYYLIHNFKKENSKNGSIFLDKDFNIEKPSTNYLIYGHRNKYGLMFEDLKKYRKEEFYNEHPTIQFTTLKEDSEYEIIAVFLSRVYNKNETDVFRYYYFIDANSKEEFDFYINRSKEASLYGIEKTAEYGDQLLTLSTCEYSQEDGRLVIVARKMKGIE